MSDDLMNFKLLKEVTWFICVLLLSGFFLCVCFVVVVLGCKLFSLALQLSAKFCVLVFFCESQCNGAKNTPRLDIFLMATMDYIVFDFHVKILTKR